MVLTNVYDAASSRTRLSATVGGTADFQNDYTYDNLLRLTRVDQVSQSGGSTVADKRLDFSYDAASRLTSLARNYKSGGNWTEAATSAFSFDTIDRLTGIDHKRGGTSLFTAYAYTFDNADRITRIVSQDGTVDYSYDVTSQLVGADYTYQTDENFSFDTNGNRTMTGYTTGTNNRMTSDGVYNYTYDEEGNVTRRTKISDSSVTDYTWDHRNRLTNVTERASAQGASIKSTDFKYDVYDRRISKAHDADGAGSGTAVTTRFVFDGDATEVVLQFDGSSNLVKRNLWAAALGLVAEENASNAILWGLGDNLTTIRDVINNSGTVQNHLKWDAFGNVTSESNAAIDFLMGFAQVVRDEETGLHYAWHRYQGNGHWWSEDPIGFSGGDANLARVVGNDPLNYVDSTGQAKKKPPSTGSSWWGPFGLTPHTFAFGPSGSLTCGLGINATVQTTISFPSWNPLDARLGILATGAGQLEPNLGAQGGFVLTASNARAPEELNGWSTTLGVDAGEVIGGGLSFGNLTSIENVTGDTPTTVNVFGGLTASAEPVSPVVGFGPTWGESLSPREVGTFIAGVVPRQGEIDLWDIVFGWEGGFAPRRNTTATPSTVNDLPTLFGP